MIPRVPSACAAWHSGVVSNDFHYPEDQAPGADPADALRLVVQVRDAEIQMLRLLVQKLKLQLVRRNRMIFGSASERFADGTPAPQGSLLEGELLDGIGLNAYFSDRGRPFQADRGRQSGVAVGSAGEARRNWFECS